MHHPSPTAPSVSVTVPLAPVLLRLSRSRAARPGIPERRMVRALGADLFDVRLAFAAVGCGTDVARFPSAADQDVAAVVTPLPAEDPALAGLATAAADRAVPAATDEVLARLSAVAEEEGVQLVPVRDDVARRGLARGAVPEEDAVLVLLATRADDRTAWLRTGEAAERLLLELVPLGWTGAPLPGATEAPLDRTRLRSALVWYAHPQLLLRMEPLR